MSLLSKRPDEGKETPFGGSPTGVPGTPADGPDQSREAKERERWTQARRRENLLWAGVMGCFLLLTLYFAGLNVWVILNSRLLPYQLQIQHTLQDNESCVYFSNVKWFPVAEVSGDLIRPRLLLGDDMIPVSGAEQDALEIDLNASYQISVALPEDITPVSHVGEIVFFNRSGDRDLPEHRSIPITVEVTDSWWENWWVVRDWLIFLIILYAITYLACLVLYPKPQGILVSSALDGGLGTPSRKITLKSHPLSLLFPWKRSEIPLQWLWRKNRISSGMVADGEIVFRDANLSPYLVLYRKKKSQFFKRPAGLSAAEEAELSQMTEVASSDTLLPGRVFVYCRHPGKMDVLFEYQKKKLFK